jgi:hypothetical protein
VIAPNEVPSDTSGSGRQILRSFASILTARGDFNRSISSGFILRAGAAMAGIFAGSLATSFGGEAFS